MTAPRTAGLRGLLPFNPDKHARFKGAAHYGFTFPAPSYPIDQTKGTTDFGMMGNGPDPSLTVNGGNPVGDCGVAGVPGHGAMLGALVAGLPLAEHTMTSNAIVTLYFTYQAELAGIAWRPEGNDWTAPEGLDNGVDLGDWLLWLFKQGIIKGFVKLETDEVDGAIAAGLIVEVGVSLCRDADERFEQHEPWDVGPGNRPDPQEGHAIDQAGVVSPTGLRSFITWGGVQLATPEWEAAAVQQRFGVIVTDDAPQALIDDLKALGGTA